MEAPEVLFFDILNCKIRDSKFGYAKIDPIFIESCVKNSIQITSAHSSDGLIFKTEIRDDIICVILQKHIKEQSSINITISGKRIGFENFRFKEKTKEQWLKNEMFWSNIDNPKNEYSKVKISE